MGPRVEQQPQRSGPEPGYRGRGSVAWSCVEIQVISGALLFKELSRAITPLRNVGGGNRLFHAPQRAGAGPPRWRVGRRGNGAVSASREGPQVERREQGGDRITTCHAQRRQT